MISAQSGLRQCRVPINMSQTLGSTGLCANVKSTLDRLDTQELLQPLISKIGHWGPESRQCLPFNHSVTAQPAETPRS